MSTFTATHGACFRAEWQKLRHTALPWLCLGAALIVPLIQTIAALVLSTGHQEAAWPNFVESSLTGFSGFFYPLFLTLLIGRIVYMEHKSDTWKVLETQPVSRAALFLVKFEVAAIIAALCLVLVLLFALIGGGLLQVLKPELDFAKSHIDWPVLLRGITRLWIASMGMLALQYYFALLIKNFAAPMTIGLIGIIAASILNNLGLLGWLPYSAIQLTANAFKGSLTGGTLLYHEWLSIAWTVALLALAYQLLRQRGFVAAHARGMRGAVTLACAALFGLLVWRVAQPQVMDRYPGTVIAGSFKTAKPIKQVALVNTEIGDTLVVAPVQNGKFRMPLGGNIPAGNYALLGGTQSVAVFFGSNDSLYVNLDATNDDYKLVFSGTRAAECEFMTRRSTRPSFSSVTQFASDKTPAAFLAELESGIETQTKAVARFHTMDNIGVGPDFLAYYRRMLQVAALREVEIEYPKTFALYNPNKELKWPDRVERLRKAVSFDDAALIGMPGFLDFATDYIQLKAARTRNRDSAFAAVSAGLLKSAPVKEAIYLRFARQRLARLPDTEAREQFVQAAYTSISNPRYQHRLQADLVRLNSLMRGRPAADFPMEAVNGAAFSLQNFAGRYVVIDVWATWCGPCRRESPIFEDMADRFTDERLVFAAVSIDEKKEDWKREVQFRMGRVLQLYAPDADERFAKPYSIQSIPRFILIDPNGRIVNANMPPPSEPEFASILQQEVYNIGR